MGIGGTVRGLRWRGVNHGGGGGSAYASWSSAWCYLLFSGALMLDGVGCRRTVVMSCAVVIALLRDDTIDITRVVWNHASISMIRTEFVS